MLDPKLNEKLRRTVSIPVRYFELARPVRFCDSPPPLPYTLTLMWEQVFPSLGENISRDKKRGYTPIPVTLESLTQTLQKLYGFEADTSSNKGFPKKNGLRLPLRTLDSLRMAHRGDHCGILCH